MRTLFALFLIPSLAWAGGDAWTPYTDGRAGGCWLGPAGMYGCTPQPAPKPQVVYVPQPAAPAAPQIVERTVYVPASAAPVATAPPATTSPAFTPGMAAAVNAQIARDLADPDAALKRELEHEGQQH